MPLGISVEWGLEIEFLGDRYETEKDESGRWSVIDTWRRIHGHKDLVRGGLKYKQAREICDALNGESSSLDGVI